MNDLGLVQYTANIINFRAESKGFSHFWETLFHFSFWFSVVFVFLGELFGACSFGVATERGLPHCCDSPLIFELLVLLGSSSLSSSSSPTAIARATLVVASIKGSATPLTSNL